MDGSRQKPDHDEAPKPDQTRYPATESMGIMPIQEKVYMRTSDSPILQHKISNVRLNQAGRIFFNDYYKIVYHVNYRTVAYRTVGSGLYADEN